MHAERTSSSRSAQPPHRPVPGDVDFYIVRENTEGEYSSIGGKIFEGTDRETVMQETVMTRTGVDRILNTPSNSPNPGPRST